MGVSQTTREQSIGYSLPLLGSNAPLKADYMVICAVEKTECMFFAFICCIPAAIYTADKLR